MQKRFIVNAGSLVCSNIIVRLIGLLQKIWIAKLITTEALGYYQLCLPVYSFFIAFAVAGLPHTVSRFCAAAIAEGDRVSCSNILKTARITGLTVSFFASALLVIISPIAASLIYKDISCWIVIAAAAPAVFFGGAGAVLSGYIHALGKTYIVSVCEVAEQVAKTAAVIGLILIFPLAGATNSASFTVLGMGIGALLSFSVIFIMFKAPNGKYTPEKIVSAALPLTGNRLLTSFLSIITAAIIPARAALSLGHYEAISAYGVFSGMALPIALLPCTVTSALGSVLLPGLSGLFAINRIKAAKRKITVALVFTAALSCICAIVLYMASDYLALKLFSSLSAGVYLRFLCPCGIIFGLNGICITALTAAGKEKSLFFIQLCTAIGGILLTYLLTGISTLNIYGYAVSMMTQGISAFIMYIILIVKIK